ncbi:hypothetical protein GF373_17195 [bacterium]|nr:hypothetical protein [bacterium]
MAVGYGGGYNSFSGVDIRAVFGSYTIGTLQGVSYSVTREKAPVYTMGQADPRSFSRGKRGIAGTLVFVVFDRHALLGVMGAMAPREHRGSLPGFLSDIDDLRPEALDSSFQLRQAATADAIRSASTSQATPGAPVELQETGGIASLNETNLDVFSDQQIALPWYSDQILPFDITLAAANEYGALAVMRIYGVEILNEGFGISVDDVQAAMQNTYVARMIVGWQSAGRENPQRPGSHSNNDT